MSRCSSPTEPRSRCSPTASAAARTCRSRSPTRVTGAAVALVVSFLALGLLWREPRLDPAAGRPAAAGAAGAGARRARRLPGRGCACSGWSLTAYVVMAAVFGRDDALNPTAGVGLRPALDRRAAAVDAGRPGVAAAEPDPVAALGCCRGALGTRPEDGLAPLPPWLGYWPAAASLLAFVWLELVAPDEHDAAGAADVLRGVPRGAPARRDVLRARAGSTGATASRCSRRWPGRLSPLGRRDDGVLVLRNPLAGVAGRRSRRGCSRWSGVLLGSTAYDSFASTPWWVTTCRAARCPPRSPGRSGCSAWSCS